MAEDWKNKLYFGDNLDIMREHILNRSIGHIYYVSRKEGWKSNEK